jgi:hypothetical protein
MSISTYFRPNIHQNGPKILGVKNFLCTIAHLGGKANETCNLRMYVDYGIIEWKQTTHCITFLNKERLTLSCKKPHQQMS